MENIAIKVVRLAHMHGIDLPTFETAQAAGTDLRAAIDAPVTLAPGARALIQTGFCMALPAGYEAQVRPRSGLALRHGITVLNSPGTIDADYRGEVGVLLINHGDAPFTVERGERFAQMVLAPVTQGAFQVVDSLDETARGRGRLRLDRNAVTLTREQTRVLDGWSLPIMILDTNMRFVYVNAAYEKTVHNTADALLGEYVFDVFPETPERIEAVRSLILRTLAGETTQLDALAFEIELEDGTTEERVWQATQEPMRDENGLIIGMIQRVQDITQQHQLEQRNVAIGYELSHRVKNIMAVVSSVARITGRNATDVKSFVTSFTARISAMSRTNDLLARGNWRGLDVASIFSDELAPYAEAQNEAFALTGPIVTLAVDATKDLSMVCHELATNAVKYGCLGKSGGHLTVNWTRREDTLVIDWRETCPHDVSDSGGVGFGTRLFDMLPYVTVERVFTPTGLHLTITMDGENVFA